MTKKQEFKLSKTDFRITEIVEEYYGKNYNKRDFLKYVREISLCLFEQYPTFFEKIFINYRERKGKKYVEKDIEVYQ